MTKDRIGTFEFLKMCYSATASLQTYAIALVGFVLGWMYGFPKSYLWFGFVFSQMQLVEYFLWKNLSSAFWNHLFSALGAFVIFLEPIFSLRMTGPNHGLVLTYILLMILSLFASPAIDFSTKVGVDGHLHWNFLSPIFSPMALVWMAFFGYGLLRVGPLGIGLALVTALYAYLKTGFRRTWSSYWCFSANVFWLYVIAWVLFLRK